MKIIKKLTHHDFFIIIRFSKHIDRFKTYKPVLVDKLFIVPTVRFRMSQQFP